MAVTLKKFDCETLRNVLKKLLLISGKMDENHGGKLLLEIHDGRAYFTALSSDYAVRSTTYLNIESNNDASIIIDGLALKSFIADSNDLTIEIKENKYILKSGKSKLSLDIEDPNKYSITSILFIEENSIIVDSDILIDVLSSVVHSIYTNPLDNKPISNIHLFSDSGILHAHAIDGKRGAIKSIQWNGPSFDTYLSEKHTNYLLAFLRGEPKIAIHCNRNDGDVTDSLLLFNVLDKNIGNHSIYISNYVGSGFQLPDIFHANVDSIDNSDSIFDRQTLVDNINKCVPLSIEGRIRLDIKNNIYELSSGSQSGNCVVKSECISDKNVSIHFNSEYMLDALESLGYDSIELYIRDTFVMLCHNKNDQDWRFLMLIDSSVEYFK
jgi:DNA polymerase III sliding clamp (beta) subunit (PCNA family)